MKDTVHYGQYLVCMMDLLGQKEMYKELEAFPIGNQNAEFKKKIIQFMQMIEYFKRDVDSFMDGAKNYVSRIEWPSHAKELGAKSRRQQCKQQRFSDGIMVFVPLGYSSNHLPISSVHTALICAASTMLISLAKGNPIRAGIGIGGAAELDEGELFGPAIGYAHEMESERAIYPRIAIHEQVIEYLNAHTPLKNTNDNNLEKQLVYQLSQLCKSMIKLDEDGEYILDYLGDSSWEQAFQHIDNEILKKAFTFISNEKCRFENENNEKLMSKYSYLHDYFTSSGRII